MRASAVFIAEARVCLLVYFYLFSNQRTPNFFYNNGSLRMRRGLPCFFPFYAWWLFLLFVLEFTPGIGCLIGIQCAFGDVEGCGTIYFFIEIIYWSQAIREWK